MRFVIAAIAAVLVGLFGAGAAYADDASYQQYLLDHGYGGGVGPAVGPNGPKVSVPGMFVDWPKTIADGHMLCDRLRSGSSYAQLEGEFGHLPYWHPIIDAAQSELCPDTL